jgi:mitotic spindle assembly checkpoint protein MAD2B
MADEAPTFRLFVSSFTDFLVVAIHTILYERGIYPQTSFLSARRYNFPVRQSRHPKVCEWVNDAVASVESELLKGTVDKLAVVIYNKQNKPLERFMFDVSRFPTVPTSEMDVPLESADVNGSAPSVLPLVDMEEQMRATMSRLSNCSASLGPLPKSCTFTVAVELKGENDAPLTHTQPWIPVQGADASRAELAGMRTTPVRAVHAGEMTFETWIEELNDKTAQQSGMSSIT